MSNSILFGSFYVSLKFGEIKTTLKSTSMCYTLETWHES